MFPLSQNDCTQYKEHRMDEVNQHSSSADTMEIGYKYQDHDEEPVLLFHKQQKTIKENSIFVEPVDLFLNRWTLKQCTERWYPLKPDIKIEPMSIEEQNILDLAHEIFGDNWTEISRRFPGRTEDYIKNHCTAIKQVKNAKEKSKNMIKIEKETNYNSEDLVTQEDELGGYVPMTLNDDYELYGLEFYPEVSMKQEINFMEAFCGNF